MKPCGFRGRVTQGSISTERTARRGQTAPFPLAQGIRTRRKTARRKSEAVTWQKARLAEREGQRQEADMKIIRKSRKKPGEGVLPLAESAF